MTESELIREVILECFPDECDVVGNANVDDIIRFTCQGTKPQEIAKGVSGGQDMPILEILQILAAATMIAKNCYELYKMLPSQTDAESSVEVESSVSDNHAVKDIQNKSEIPTQPPVAISESKATEIREAVYQKISNK